MTIGYTERWHILNQMLDNVNECSEQIEVTPKELVRFLLTAYSIGESIPGEWTDRDHEIFFDRLCSIVKPPFDKILAQADDNPVRKVCSPHWDFLKVSK